MLACRYVAVTYTIQCAMCLYEAILVSCAFGGRGVGGAGVLGELYMAVSEGVGWQCRNVR